MPRSEQCRKICGDLLLVTRHHHRVGCILLDLLAPQQIQRRLAAGVQQPRVVVDEDELGPDDRRECVTVGGSNAGGRSFTSSISGAGTSADPTPSACSSSDRIPSDSGLAAAGSPQAFHFIGMRYSITHAVNQ